MAAAPIPSRQLFGSQTPATVDQRRAQLQQYLQATVGDPQLLEDDELQVCAAVGVPADWVGRLGISRIEFK